MLRSGAFHHLLVTAAVCLAGPSSVWPQDGTPAPATAPQAVVITKTAELGTIPRGQTVSHEFLIENRGHGPLEITTRAQCGCTVVEHDKVIPPGGQGKIKAELRTNRLRGEFQKSIQVQTNDPAQPRLQLELSGRILETVELVPPHDPRMTLKPDGPTELEVGVRTIDDVEVTGVTSTANYVQTRLEPNGERAYRLQITVGAEAPFGQSTFVVKLATTAPDQTEIPVTVSCEKGIVVRPASLGFTGGRRGADASPKSMVLLRKREGQFQIGTVTSSDPNLQVEVVALKEGSLYRVVASYRGDLAKLGGTEVVIVETDDPHQPKLEIPITGTVRTTPVRASSD